jgi:hypothetical protein
MDIVGAFALIGARLGKSTPGLSPKLSKSPLSFETSFHAGRFHIIEANVISR